MQKNIALLLLSMIIFSCANNQGGDTAVVVKKDSMNNAARKPLKRDASKIGPAKSAEQKRIEEDLKKVQGQENELLGCWVGTFGKNKINIFIAEVNGSEASGHSVCAGNFREIKGEVNSKGNGIFSFVLKEPGDDKYDGKFEFTIDESKKILEGKWSPFNTGATGATGAKEYSLAKREFKYDSTLGTYPEASTRLLTEEDVSNHTKEELTFMRNEIYARHGYSFKTKEVRAMFDQLDWYVPVCIDVRDVLTETELANIDLISEYEKYYEESYDNYGR